jgi:glucokinase
MHILCGDIGGTKTRLAIFFLESGAIHPVVEKTYSSPDYNSLIQIASAFISNRDEPISHAVFGVAGSVLGRNCNTTNLPWKIDAHQMEQDLAIPSVHLINDLEATAWGISTLAEDDFYTLQPGSLDAIGNRAVIAAGTGLGEAGMFWDGVRHLPFASEGGHCNFAPSNELECELLSYLQQCGHPLCWEDILSGPGLTSIYRFLLHRQQASEPEWFKQQQKSGDPAEAISNMARDNQDALCTEAMQMFARLYGTEAGNLALKLMATGGVYIGGGIAPKILKWLQQPAFLEAFCNKAKMRSLLESMSVKVILNDRAALYGPAIYLREKQGLAVRSKGQGVENSR